MDSDEPLYVLDACCVINLLASGSSEAILRGLPFRIGVADLVAVGEVLHTRVSAEEDEKAAAAVDVTVTLEPLIQAGVIDVMTAASPAEIATYVDLALLLDDGEALSASLAIHRGAVLVTDDRKALRVVRSASPEVAIRRTSCLLKAWFESAAPPASHLREVLRNVRERGSFVPPRDDPQREWWELHENGR